MLQHAPVALSDSKSDAELRLIESPAIPQTFVHLDHVRHGKGGSCGRSSPPPCRNPACKTEKPIPDQ